MAVKTLNVAEKRTFKSGGKKSEMAEKNSRIGRRLISKHGHYEFSSAKHNFWTEEKFGR